MQQQEWQVNQQHSKDMDVQPDRETSSTEQIKTLERDTNQLTLEALQPNLLADFISQVPLVRMLLPCDSKKAVLSTSRQCRRLMRSLTTAVAINTLDDLKAISGSAWPSLGIVVIQQQIMKSVASLANAWCKLQVLATFRVGKYAVRGYMGILEYMVLILKPRTDQQCRDLGIKSQLDSLSRVMHTIRPWDRHNPWHVQTYIFALNQSQLDSASLLQLFSTTWPKLRLLDLSHTTLDAAAVTALAMGSWPELWSVSLSCSSLNNTAIAQLTPKLWPRLTKLHLRGTSFAVPDASLAEFVAAWPRIWHLDLQDMQLGADFTAVLARPRTGLESLKKLQLQSVSLDAETLSGFTTTSWPLTILHMKNSGLGSDATGVLALCSFPLLFDLNLSHNQLDEAAAQRLIAGRWPLLHSLNVSHNALGNRAMKALAEGQWPGLRSLYLQGNAVDAVEITVLVKGQWPLLQQLQLDHMAVSAATWALLHLDPAPVAHNNVYYSVPRLHHHVSGESLVWDHLCNVTFGEAPDDPDL